MKLANFCGALVAGALLIAAHDARAVAPTEVTGTGYVCRVMYTPPLVAGTPAFIEPWGQFGAVMFSVYSAPNCGGTFNRYLTTYSQGSPVNSISYSIYTPLGEAALMELHRALTTASMNGRKVLYYAAQFPGGFGGIMSQTEYVVFDNY